MSTPNTLALATADALPDTLPPAVAALIPLGDHDDWLALAADDRARIRDILAALVAVRDRTGGKAGGRTLALRALARANAGRRGWSFPRLRTLYYALAAARWDWRVLTPGYSHDSSLPPEFRAHLRALTLQEHRSRKQAIAKIRAAWRAGKSIPGYGTWREWFQHSWPARDVPAAFAGDYPRGWSTSNLYLHMPPRAQHALATRGYAAAHGDIPHVIRDTSALRPMELVVFDDFECDVLAIFERRVVRVRGVLALDVATRRVLGVGFKPALTDDEGKKRAITRADVQFLISSIFTRHGVPRDYRVTLLVENAAAAIGEGLEAALDLFFHGQVRVQRTGMLDHRTLANGFLERGGKPWEKGWIESAFNLMHNLAGSLPAQKGARYELAPATTAARVAYAEGLLRLDLTDEQRAQLRQPIESFAALTTAYEEIFAAMDRRTEHKLQGFDQVTEWSRGAGDPWRPIAEIVALPAAEQLAVEIRQRPESPIERWEKLAARQAPFAPVPEFVIALLAFTPRLVRVRNRKIVFAHDGADHVFLDLAGCCNARKEGEELLGYFDPASADKLFVTDLRGRAVGVLTRNAPADITRPGEISAAGQRVAQFFHSQIQAPVREALAGVDAQLGAARANNDALLASWQPAALATTPRPNLSRTLADDTYAVSAPARFDGAATVAAGLGAVLAGSGSVTEARPAELLARRAAHAQAQADLATL